MSSEDAVNPVHTLLHHTKCSQVVEAGRQIHCVAAGDSVESAVQLLSTHKIQSCPVLKTVGGKKVCQGMVDMLDVASYVVSVAPTDRELEDHELRRLEMAGRAIALVPVSQVIDISGRDPLVPVFETSPVSQVCAVFATGVHHVAIFNDSEDAVTNVLSQTDLLKFLNAHLHMGDSKIVGGKTLAELGLGQGGCVSVTDGHTVIDGLRKMQEKNVTCLAIVHRDTDRLQANFSASDLVGLYQENFPAFKSAIPAFLEKYSEKSLSPIVCQPDSTLIDVVKLLSEHGIHHLWVVDGDYKPTGIVSITDICKVINNYKYA